jgi:tripartite-type tricarboxylate transporter receptor subunit TctC
MTILRRQFLLFAGMTAALPALPRVGRAQTFPTRTVHMIVGFPAGGATDVVARLMGQWLAERLGGSFVLPASIAHIKAGKLRALAVTTAMRSPALPEVTTVGEFLPSFEVNAFVALCAPKNTPPDIIEKLNTEINAAFSDPTMKARINELGGMPFPGSAAALTKYVADETEKWGKVIRAANIKAK